MVTFLPKKYQNPFTCLKVTASQRWDVFWDKVCITLLYWTFLFMNIRLFCGWWYCSWRSNHTGCKARSTTGSGCSHWTWNAGEAHQSLHFTLLAPVTRQQTFLCWYIFITCAFLHLCNDLFLCSVVRNTSPQLSFTKMCSHWSCKWWDCMLSFTGCLMATHVDNKLAIMLQTTAALLDPALPSIVWRRAWLVVR